MSTTNHAARLETFSVLSASSKRESSIDFESEMRQALESRNQRDTVRNTAEGGPEFKMTSQRPSDVARERRRIQNKLAQRKHRERQKLMLESRKTTDLAVDPSAESAPASATASEFSSTGSEWTLGDVEDYLHLERNTEQLATVNAFMSLPTLPQTDLPFDLKVSDSAESVMFIPEEPILRHLQQDPKGNNCLFAQSTINQLSDVPVDPQLCFMPSYLSSCQPDLCINKQAPTPAASYYGKWYMGERNALDRSNEMYSKAYNAQVLNASLLRSSKRKTVLHVAVENGHYDITIRLLAAGADIDAVDDRGRSALHYAVILGHKEIVMALLSYGANQTVRTVDGWTILHTAAHCGWGHIVDLLLSSGGNVNGRVLE